MKNKQGATNGRVQKLWGEMSVAKLAGTITQSKITFLGVDGAEIAYRFPSDILAHAFDAALKRLAKFTNDDRLEKLIYLYIDPMNVRPEDQALVDEIQARGHSK